MLMIEKRRSDMLKPKSSLVVLMIVCLLVAPMLSQAASKPIIIRTGYAMNTEESVHFGGLKFAEIVAKKTNDRIQVKLYPAGQLGDTTQEMGNLKMGEQEIYIETGTVGSRFVADFLVLTVPFLMRDNDHANKVYNGAIGMELANKLLKTQGIRMITSSWDIAPRHLLTKKKVTSLKDLTGLKVRVPQNPIFLKSWKELGASPTPMSLPEVYLGLQQGAIEGVEMPLDWISTQKYYEAAKYCWLTYHAYEMRSVYMNDKFFQSLTPEDQKIVRDALIEAGVYQNKILDDQFKSIKDQLSKQGVVFSDMPAAERERAAAITLKVGVDEEAGGRWEKGLISKIRAVK